MTKRGRAKRAAQGARAEVNVPEKTQPEGFGEYEPGINKNGLRQTLKEMPVDLIVALAEQYPKVLVEIKRRNNRGQLAALGYSGMMWEPAEVLQVADWLLPRAGGGLYVVSISNPKNTLERLTPSFEVPIDAPVRAAIPYHVPVPGAPVFGVPSSGAAPFYPTPSMPMPGTPLVVPQIDPSRTMSDDMAKAPAVPGVLPPPRNPMNSKWSQGLDPISFAQFREGVAAQAAQAGQPFAYGYGAGPVVVQGAPGATFSSDQLAVDTLRRVEAEKAELRAKLDALSERAAERDREHEKTMREMLERHREELHTLRLEMLRAELGSKREPQGLKVPELIAALAPFAPVFAAMVTSTKESTTKSMEIQQQGLNQLVQLMVSQANKPSPDPLAAVEKLMPLLAGPTRGGESNAALIEAMSNANLQQTAMTAQLLEALASSGGESQPAWLPVVQQIGAGLVQMAQGMAADRQRAMLGAPQLGAPQRPLPATVQSAPLQRQAPPQATAPQTPYRTLDEEAPQPQPPQPQPQAPVGPQKPLVRLNPAMLDLLPAEYRTPEWRAIILALHEGRDPAQVAEMLAKHLVHLLDFDMLPSQLANFAEDPRESLYTLVKPLPVYTANNAYCAAVIETTLSVLYEMGHLVQDDEPEEMEESDEGDEAPEDDGDETSEDEGDAQPA